MGSRAPTPTSAAAWVALPVTPSEHVVRAGHPALPRLSRGRRFATDQLASRRKQAETPASTKQPLWRPWRLSRTVRWFRLRLALLASSRLLVRKSIGRYETYAHLHAVPNFRTQAHVGWDSEACNLVAWRSQMLLNLYFPQLHVSWSLLHTQ